MQMRWGWLRRQLTSFGSPVDCRLSARHPVHSGQPALPSSRITSTIQSHYRGQHLSMSLGSSFFNEDCTQHCRQRHQQVATPGQRYNHDNAGQTSGVNSMTSAAADASASAGRIHGSSAPGHAADQAYAAEPLSGSPFGAEVRNFSLTQPMDPSVIERIKRNVSRLVSSATSLPKIALGINARHMALPQSDGWDVDAGTRCWCSETRESSAEMTRCLPGHMPAPGVPPLERVQLIVCMPFTLSAVSTDGRPCRLASAAGSGSWSPLSISTHTARTPTSSGSATTGSTAAQVCRCFFMCNRHAHCCPRPV